GWIDRLSLSDPTKSGSVKTAYDMIFQQYGWEKGWRIVTLMVANASVIRDGGSNPAEDVGSADAVAGVGIDFFGWLRVRRAGRGEHGGCGQSVCGPAAVEDGSGEAHSAGKIFRRPGEGGAD